MIFDQVFSTEPVANGTLRYRIEVRMVSSGVFQQRHIWLDGNASHGVSYEGVEPWIASFRSIFDDVRVRGYEVSDVLAEVGRWSRK